MGKTCAFELVGKTLVVVSGEQGASDQDWVGLVEQARRGGFDRVLVHGMGSPPSAKQRNELREALGDVKDRPGAMLTSSQVMLASMAVLSLFLRKTKAFSPKDEPAAFDFIGVPAPERPAVSATLTRLRAWVAPQL